MTKTNPITVLGAVFPHMLEHDTEELTYKLIYDDQQDKKNITKIVITSREKDTEEIRTVTLSVSQEINKTATILKENQEKKEND